MNLFGFNVFIVKRIADSTMQISCTDHWCIVLNSQLATCLLLLLWVHVIPSLTYFHMSYCNMYLVKNVNTWLTHMITHFDKYNKNVECHTNAFFNCTCSLHKGQKNKHYFCAMFWNTVITYSFLYLGWLGERRIAYYRNKLCGAATVLKVNKDIHWPENSLAFTSHYVMSLKENEFQQLRSRFYCSLIDPCVSCKHVLIQLLTNTMLIQRRSHRWKYKTTLLNKKHMVTHNLLA